MIHTTSASGCHFAKKLKGASFSRNVNTQFNVTLVLAEFVYCLPHINPYAIAVFLPPEHLPVLHLGEGEGHCESTVSYPRTQRVIPARGQNWTS